MGNFFRTAAILIAIVVIGFLAYFIYDSVRVHSTTEKIAEIIHLEDSRDMNSDLREYCSDPDPLVREKAARAIGRISAKGAAELLLPMLSDSSLDVAATAAFALGLTGESDYAAKLLEIAYDLPARVSAWAVTSAGRLADSSMTEVTSKIASFLSHPSPEVREATCFALFACNAKEEVKALIPLMATEPDDQVKIKALYTLSRLGIKEAGFIYEEFLTDSDPWVRTLAVRGLGRLEGKDATRYLGIALNDGDNRVVVQAVYELLRNEDEQSKKMLAKKFENETDENLLIEMLTGLRMQQNDQGMPRAISLLDSAASDNIVAAALQYITSIRKERAVALIDSMLVSPSPQIKIACADAYGLVGHENVVKRLATLFNDEDPDVRATAFSALAQVDSSDFEFFIERALDDKDYVPVVLAINEVASRKLARFKPQLIALSEAVPPPDIDIRRSLVEAASVFLKENKSDSIAMQLLINGALDREYVVRKDAAAVYSDVLNEDRSDLLGRVNTRISVGDIECALGDYQSPPQAIIKTSQGNVIIELDLEAAPLTVINFIDLAESGEYDGLIFHRIVPNFVVQGGDPRGDGWGGPGYAIRCEYSEEHYERGTVGIATSGRDTGGSQFFVTLSPQPHLDAHYTIFGRVISGMEIVERIVHGDVIEEITIEKEPI